MKVLVTGAKGFVGKNLCLTLKNIANGCDKSRGIDSDIAVYEYDLDTDPSCLREWTRDCDFVFHLAGVNRPKETSEFMEGNFGFTDTLLKALEEAGIPMASAEVTMIPQTWTELTSEEDLKKMNKILDLLDEDDDVQAVYHNWDEGDD